jgi:hypothetical protein
MNDKQFHRSAKPAKRTPKPITHEQIAALAYELWVAQGQPAGSDIDIWLEAERQLSGAPPRPIERDPIPADPDRADADDDIALADDVDREIRGIASPPQQRSPTSLP